jgi:O-antigen/teichoic acid export membrane protein
MIRRVTFSPLLARSIASNWLGLLVFGSISLLLTPILIARLGYFYFGMWVLVGSLVDYFGLLDVGMRTTLQRFVASLTGEEDRDALNETFMSALAVTLAASLVILGLTPALATVLTGFFGIAHTDTSVFRWLVGLLGLHVAVTLVSRLLGAYLCGLHRFDLYNLVEILTSCARAALMIFALFLGYGVIGIAGASLATTAFSVVLKWRLARRVNPSLVLDPKGVSWLRTAELLRFSVHLMLYSIGDHLRSYTDAAVIGRWLSIALITPFSIAVRLMEFFKLLVTAVVSPLLPAMTELHVEENRGQLQRLFLRATKTTALMSFFLAALLFLNGHDLIRLWVGDLADASFPVMLVLLVGTAAGLAQAPTANVLVACGRPRPLGWWTLVEGIANLSLSIYWAQSYGLLGVAMGTAVPMLIIKAVVQPWYALRLLHLTVREYVATALAAPVALGGAFTILLWLILRLWPAPGLLALVVRVSAEGLIFSYLTYRLILDAGERQSALKLGRAVVHTLRRLGPALTKNRLSDIHP